MGLNLPSFTKEWHSTTYPAIAPSQPALSAAGKSVAITGGGQGIGAAAARSFAEAGATHIAILGRTKATLDQTASALSSTYPNVKIHAYAADVVDAAAVDKALGDFAAAVGGKMDILVSNASYLPDQVTIKDLTPDQYIKDLAVNIKSPLVLVQSFLKHGKPDGLIINVTSASPFLSTPSPAAYTVGKEAALRFFQLFAEQHPELKTVNIHPGVVETDMNRKSGVPAMDDGKHDRLAREVSNFQAIR
jgi:NAD(P)-dependent dehydrogenase (short-subunit alcohol dehydrogenase family)